MLLLCLKENISQTLSQELLAYMFSWLVGILKPGFEGVGW